MNKPQIFTIIGMLILFLIVLIIHHIYSSQVEGEDINHHPLVPEFKNLMLIFCILYLAYIIQAILENYNIPTPYGGFIIIIGFLWGSLAYYVPPIFLATTIVGIRPSEVIIVYMTVVVFNLSFCLDVPIFKKTLSQILVIGIPVCVATGALFGTLATYALTSGFDAITGILIGIFCVPLHPHSVIKILNQQSLCTKQISVLLEGEALIVFFIAEVAYKLLVGNMSQVVVYWYQYVAILTRIVVMGLMTGFAMGLTCRYLVRRMYTNRLSLFIICCGAPFFTYSLSDIFMSGCGSLSVIIMGTMLGQERSFLPKDVDKFLADFWESASLVMDAFVCGKSAITAGIFITPQKPWRLYLLVLITYIMYYTMRFTCFMLFSPIISRLGYGIDFKNTVVCVWGGLKSPVSMEIAAVFVELSYYTDIAEEFYFYIIGLYFLSVFINGSFTTKILDILGLRRISLARQVNMNNCMKHIFVKRERTIAILKFERFLADANWDTVMEVTNMQHPYKVVFSKEVGDDLNLGYRQTWCGDCKKEVPQEPSPKEMKEIMRDAKMRVLKAKKISYSRQFANGMMSKEGIRILTQAIELATDSEDAEIKIEDLHKRFIEENWFVRFIRKQAETVQEKNKSDIKPPRTYWRRLCYHLVVTNKTFDKVMLFIVILNLIVIGIDISYHPSLFALSGKISSHSLELSYFLLAAKITFAAVYLAEFIIKILAYSWIHICQHGFRTYFKSVMNIIDFVVLIGCILGVERSTADITEQGIEQEIFDHDVYRQIIDVLRFLRVIRLARVFEIFYHEIITYLENSVNTKMALTYELGKSYATGEAEILNMLPYMIDNTVIREEVKRKLKSDRILVTKLIGVVQKERPWIAITVKTTQVIRTILNGMQEAVNELKSSGWIDAYEYEKLGAAMDDLYQKVSSINNVQPSPPKEVFKEVAWMAGDEIVIDFLFENVAMKKFEPGEVAFAEGSAAGGIYIVVTGLFVLDYTPHYQVLFNLHEHGQLPIVDYLSGTKYEESSIDYIVSGNCIGELSTLTERSYNCIITAEVHSQVYVLSRAILKRAMELSPDPTGGLQCRIWKEVSVRIAAPLLLSVPAYQSFTYDQIKYALERAFVPDLRKFKIFSVTDMIEDIILIEGIVLDFNARTKFIAPCYIPRTVQKLILPTSSLIDFPVHVKTILLIIPAKDVDEYDVMTDAEETCEMVRSKSSSKCLLHTAQQRMKNRGRFRRGIPSAHSRRMRKPQSTYSSSVGYGSRFFTNASSTYYKDDKGGSVSIYLTDDEEEKHTLDYQRVRNRTP